MPSENTCLIAVHAGAGYHSVERGKTYRNLCASACKEAMTQLRLGATALEAVTIAVKVLENAPCLNAGTGSSLNIDGNIECDASVMDGDTLYFGAVGAVSEIKNPIMVAKKLVDEQKLGIMSMGRIPPRILVGPGATRWAEGHGIPRINEDCLKTDSSIRTYKDHKRRLEDAETRRRKKRYLKSKNTSPQKRKRITESSADVDHEEVVRRNNGAPARVTHSADVDNEETDRRLLGNGVQDTVGAVCVDIQGNMAAGVSSGGISLKQQGRLGPAAECGAGCWATNGNSENKPGIAVATSGTGEYLMRTSLARQCAECMQNSQFPDEGFRQCIEDKFLGSDFLQDVSEKCCGILALRLDPSNEDSRNCDLLWGHTTDSMCIGYMSHDTKPQTLISRLDENKTYIMEGKLFKL